MLVVERDGDRLSAFIGPGSIAADSFVALLVPSSNNRRRAARPRPRRPCSSLSTSTRRRSAAPLASSRRRRPLRSSSSSFAVTGCRRKRRLRLVDRFSVQIRSCRLRRRGSQWLQRAAAHRLRLVQCRLHAAARRRQRIRNRLHIRERIPESMSFASFSPFVPPGFALQQILLSVDLFRQNIRQAYRKTLQRNIG